MQSLRELYTGVYEGKDFDDKLRQELTADIIGEYIFTDTDFINKLSTEHRNIFKKIYDEIKYLCKVATAGSKEARELEKLKKTFEDAWKQSGKVEAKTDSGTEYSVEKFSQIQYNLSRKNNYGENINGFYYALNKKQWRDFYQQIADNGYLERTNIGDEICVIVDNKLIVAERQMTGKDAHDFQVVAAYEFAGINNSDILEVINESGVLDGIELTTDIILGFFEDASSEGTISRIDRTDLSFDNDFTERQKSSNGSKTYGVYEAETNGQGVSVGNEQNTQGIEIEDIVPVKETSSEDGVFFDGEKTKYSLSDSEGRELSKEQREYFKDSKIKDANGNLKVMHHGSHERFTVFDKKNFYIPQ